jgi:hypothetical protein
MRWFILAIVILVAGSAAAQYIQNTNTGQVSCGTTATIVAAARGRNAITIKNPTGASVSIYIGGPAVTTSTGLSIDAAAAMTLQPFNGAVYCVAASAQTVSFLESF